jgi:WD40 repeat protein
MKRHHNAFINDIIVVESHNFILACDLDGIISLWNLNTLEFKQDLRGHLKGVLSLCWLEEKNLLLSSGYEHEVYIWDIVVGKKINSLQGHSQSLIGIKIFPGTPQIISGDVSGIFKVWDIRSMNLVQTFSIPTSINKRANSFVVTTVNKKRIIIGADKVYFYDYEESKEGNLADSKSCIAVLYNDVFNTFVTAHIDSIKIWKVETGELINVFRELTNKEISAVCFDYRKRKLFIGDVEGNLILINILNGVQMKYFTSHRDYISSMTYYSEGKKFMSASWDGAIKVHDDDTSEEKGQLLSVFGNINSSSKGKMISCNSIDFSENLELLASGYDNGLVTLINMRTLSNEGSLSHDKIGRKITFEKDTFITEEEKKVQSVFHKEIPKIKLVKFLNNLNSIITCDNLGRLFLWTLVPSKPRKTVLDQIIENLSINENNKRDFFPIKCLSFEEKTNYLVVGDETGHVKAWNIEGYISYLKKMCELFEERDIFSSNRDKDSSNFSLPHKNFSLNKVTEVDFKTPMEKYEKLRQNLNLKPQFIKEIPAHKNGVNSICCHSDPIFFATAGLDCKVHIWNVDFEKIGSLTTIRDPSWGVKIDVEKERIRRREEALEYYKNSKSITYESLFENELKITSYDVRSY